MKRFLFLFSTFFCILFYHTTNPLAAETPSSLFARSAILMDGENQRVLFGKEERTKLPMASTTKIMTCLYTLEHADLSDVVTFSENAASAPKVHLGAKAGSRYLLSDLLYALMLESANDAAVAIAEHVGGSVENFCAAMTQEARDYGCYDTSFETPNGLDSENHYTTCYDLAILAGIALRREDFRAIVRESSYTIKEIDSGASRTLQNKDAFLSSYPGAIGVKTGYTSGAGYCFVGAVESEDRLLISVVLGSGWYPNRSYKWKDTRKLMDYGMENYQETTVTPSEGLPERLPVTGGQKACCSLSGPESFSLLLRPDETVSIETDLPTSLTAPIAKGDAVGTVSVSIDGTLYRTFSVTARTGVKALSFSYCFRKMLRAFFAAVM